MNIATALLREIKQRQLDFFVSIEESIEKQVIFSFFFFQNKLVEGKNNDFK